MYPSYKYTGLKYSSVLCMWDNKVISVVFCVVTAMNKFNFRLIINKIPNKWPVERRSCSDRSHVFDMIYMTPTVVTSVKDSTPSVKSQLHSLQQGTVLLNPKCTTMSLSTLQTQECISTEGHAVNCSLKNNRCLVRSFLIPQQVVHIVTNGLQTVKQKVLRDRKLRLIAEKSGSLSGSEQGTIWRTGVSPARTAKWLCSVSMAWARFEFLPWSFLDHAEYATVCLTAGLPLHPSS
jgi:hypothetical protein